jgi:hypothetical protein
MEPVFVIGTNRSGTSVVSAVLSQHPELEGLFSGKLESTTDSAGHSIGFCESMHIWSTLRGGDNERRRNNELPFWGLPHYLHANHRCHARDEREKFELAWEVERLRHTNKSPLIKDQFNILRVGLITEIFPRARFVLVSRPWQDFVERGIHKWTHDGLGTELSGDRPYTGFHWHLLNIIARYELEIYAPGRYAEVWLDALRSNEENARRTFKRVLVKLGLHEHEFDLGLLSATWTAGQETAMASEHQEFLLVREIVEHERKVLTSRMS